LISYKNLHGLRFATVSNESGASDSGTCFSYFVDKDVIYGDYGGGHIVKGQFIGKALSPTKILLAFQCLTDSMEILCGQSVGDMIDDNGKIGLDFSWNWSTPEPMEYKSSYRQV
jgi:hypothetical protein